VALKQIQKQMTGMLGVNLQIFDYYSVIENFVFNEQKPVIENAYTYEENGLLYCASATEKGFYCYSYCLNNPLSYVDPTGQFFTKYKDWNGNLLLDTDDGRDDVFYVPAKHMDAFKESVNFSAELKQNSTKWNDYWRSQFMQLSDMQIGVLNMQHSERARRDALTFWHEGTIGSALRYFLSEGLAQWSTPELVVGGLSAGLLGWQAMTGFKDGANVVARHGVQTGTKGTTVLGKYPDYINLASELGARRFNVPINIWNKMTPAEQWAANVRFLDRTLMRGDNIILSNRVTNINNVTGSFRKELEYLMDKGIKINQLQLVR
jgi:hypothetical protein